MDLKWMGNIYQKFEVVCQEVDHIVGQDRVKYFENRVQDVGDNMKKLYSGVVHELLPKSSKEYEANSVHLKDSTDSSVKSVGGVKDSNKNIDGDTVNFTESLKDSTPIDDITDDQQAGASIKHDIVNQDTDSTDSSVGGVKDSNKNVDEDTVNFTESLKDSTAIDDITDDQQAGDSIKHDLVNQDTDSTDSSVGGVKDSNKNIDEENTVNNFTELKDSTAIDDITDDQQAAASFKHDLVNQDRDETCSGSTETENYYTSEEEVEDDSRETSEDKKENLHAIEQILAYLESFEKKETLISSVHSESYSGFSESVCGDLVRTKDNIGVNVEPSSCLVVEENNTSVDEKESTNLPLFSESSVDEQGKHGTLAEVSPATSSLSCERPITETGSLCCESSSITESPYSKSQGSCSEIESHENSSCEGSWSVSDTSMAHVCSESSIVTGQNLESQDGLVSTGCCQSMKSNDESLISSPESIKDGTQLNDDVNLEESCVIVDESELYAVSSRVQKLRSYKKRIQDAFAPKRRLAKEYEQLAIWYGDTETEYSQGTSRTVLRSRMQQVDSNKLQASETEWELL